jgi:hypothetical protein
VSVEPSRTAAVLGAATSAGVPAVRIGVTGGGTLRIRVRDVAAIEMTVSEARSIWSTALAAQLDGQVA